MAAVLLPAPGPMAVSAGTAVHVPLEVRWIAAAPPPAAPAEATERVSVRVEALPRSASPDAAPSELVAQPTTGAHEAAASVAPVVPRPSASLVDETADETVYGSPMFDSTLGGTGFVLPMPDLAMPGPVTVLRLALSVDATGHVAALEPLDPDALDALVDAVREAFVGQPLPGVGAVAATAPRWHLEVRFVEGTPNGQWRLWRAS
ncbi:hypothetical protein [Azohydromonas sediminis]|uniref:hypothetical protein n=1 Tax=Azohydromonas sediminis TaxID=2259674 RepID=UPI000E657F64|nr:hypothetical protein [Azohydromonas sediminis]